MNYSEIRTEARGLLSGRWNQCLLVWLIYFALVGGSAGLLGFLVPGLSSLITVFVGGPFTLGFILIFMKVYRRQEFAIDEIFDGFKDFTRALVAYLLVLLYTILWSLLLIVPGIIASIGYSQVFYIMAEDKNIKPDEALRKSKAMMMGHKNEYCLLQLSFFGWGLLGMLTFGIGLLWLNSYVQTANVIFYQRIKEV